MTGILLLGSLLGFGLWMVALASLNRSAIKRDALRINRQFRRKNQAHRREQIQKSFSGIGGSIAMIGQAISTRKAITKKQLSKYKKAAIDLELFASQKTRNAHEKLLNLLTAKTPPSGKQLSIAKKSLFTAIQNE